MLLFDEHESHCIYEFLNYCEKNSIVLFCLSSHSTHLLQSLDVVIFQLYKHYHAETVNQVTRTNCDDFNKTKFCVFITSIRKKIFNHKTIRFVWRKTSLVSIQLRMILNKLREYEPVSEISSQFENDSIDSSTLYTVRRLCRQIKHIMKNYD